MTAEHRGEDEDADVTDDVNAARVLGSTESCFAPVFTERASVIFAIVAE
jgi:hypothetical protein